MFAATNLKDCPPLYFMVLVYSLATLLGTGWTPTHPPPQPAAA